MAEGAPSILGDFLMAPPVLSAFSSYLEARMARILLLGMMSGFPWVLIGSTLSLWLKEEGLSRSTVGWAGLIFAVYAVNFLWAPLIDRIRVPFLTERFGHRKAWILFFQTIILASLIVWGCVSPSLNLAIVIAAGLAIATCSASQDITIDALRIEQIKEGDSAGMAAGAAVAVVGWWSGYKLGGLVSLLAADWFQVAGYENYWHLTFIIQGAMIIGSSFLLLLIPETGTAERLANQRAAQEQVQQQLGSPSVLAQTISFLITTVIIPLLSFFRQNGLKIGLMILGFIFLFKIGEAFMGKMSIIFYKELGFSKSDIALYSKGLGWITTVCFTLLGGYFALRSGAFRALMLAGIAMALTNILFSMLAWTGKSEWLFAVAVVLDDLAAAFATVAFVTFISLLVDRNYTATQYALLASIGTIGRTVFASSSGALVDWLGGDWGLFFIITALMVIPSLILLYWLKDKAPAFFNIEK
tara:strand:- start:5147 stop:6559 length:1413 start_codon:yes stop_codon:yes gene_type:complete